MRGSTISVYHCPFECLRRHSARPICGRLPENFCTTTLVLRHLVPQTHWDTQAASVTFECGPDPQRSQLLQLSGPNIQLSGPNITDARNIQPLAQRTSDSLSRPD